MAYLHAVTSRSAFTDRLPRPPRLRPLSAGIVQYNNEGGGLNIASMCTTLTAPGVQPVDALATIVNSYTGGQCMDNSYGACV